jgi:poly(A) polymerase
MHIDPTLIDPDATKVVRRLQHHGCTAYLVGGCVRDLLLGRTPKDFDVATSATPGEVKRLFRNCRLIGRRFRLAHVFFGAKIIETSTFRQNPRVESAEDADELLIRRDNVFGTAEEDARRRDFTINGLFYDVATEQVIDYVGGTADLTAGLVRTIGDPDIRLKEDPIRILRAIKFAARLGFAIDPATYRAMLACRSEIPKCAAPRILEEIYRLLRGGAAAAAMRLLIQTGVLDVLVPELAELLRNPSAIAGEVGAPRAAPGPDAADLASDAPVAAGDRDEGAPTESSPAPAPAAPVERFFATLELLDALWREPGAAPLPNAVILAAALWPFLDGLLEPEGARGHEVATLVDERVRPVLLRLHASRRDSERVRQILVTQRRLEPAPRRRHRAAGLSHRDHFPDALLLHRIICQVRGVSQGEVEHWRQLLGRSPATEPPAEPSEDSRAGGRRRRRRRGGRRHRGRPETRPVEA